MKECGILHHFDFAMLNSTGTAYKNDHCSLVCAIDGKVISTNSIHENTPCPTSPSGVFLQSKHNKSGRVHFHNISIGLSQGSLYNWWSDCNRKSDQSNRFYTCQSQSFIWWNSSYNSGINPVWRFQRSDGFCGHFNSYRKRLPHR